MQPRLGRFGLSFVVVVCFVGQFLSGTSRTKSLLSELNVPLDAPVTLDSGANYGITTEDTDDAFVGRPTHLAEQITLVMLTGDEKRYVDLRDIVAVGSNHSLIEEVVIIWNNPNKPEGYAKLQEKLGKYLQNNNLRILRASKNTLNNRYDPNLLKVKTGAVLILDDDLSILPETIDCLHESWLANKTHMHSLGPSRQVYEEGYAMNAKNSGRKPNFLLPRFLFDAKYLNVYFDPVHTAVRQYVDGQDAHCDDIAFAAVITKHTGLPLIYVPGPHGSREPEGDIYWYNTLRQHALSVKKQFTQSQGISKGGVKYRVNTRDECSRGIIHMLNWIMPAVKHNQCSYSRKYSQAQSYGGDNYDVYRHDKKSNVVHVQPKNPHENRARVPAQARAPAPAPSNFTHLILPQNISRPHSWDRQEAGTRRPLNFLHIPKTGGSSVVSLAIQHNKTWGECLFLDEFKLPGTTTILKCPHSNPPWPMDQVFTDRRFWHTPIQFLPSRINNENEARQNPYEGHDLFAVIRNPYERVISEFYYQCSLRKSKCKAKDHPVEGPRLLNSLIQTALTKFIAAESNSAGYYSDYGHWIPQSDFIRNAEGQQLVQHVLHMEHLKEQFDSMAKAYNLTMRLPTKRTRSKADFAGVNNLGVQHLTRSTLNLLERVYKDDFVLGGYQLLGTAK